MNALDRTVATMMSRFGTKGFVVVTTSGQYDPATSENVVTTKNYPVNILVFDYVRKTEGEGTESNTLVKSGDKQVFIQPPQKTPDGLPLPHLEANRDMLKIGGTTYKIVTVKQFNPSLSSEGCVAYELYIRE